MDFIFLHGAPGTGKSTTARRIHERTQCPFFEFGWIPEFRSLPHSMLPYEEEEQFSFENLILVLKNYQRRGFRNVIVTDLRDHILQQVPREFESYEYAIVTLVVKDDEILKARVLDETRSSGYRDWQTALRINQELKSLPLLKHETRIDTTHSSVDLVAEAVINVANQETL